MNPTFKRSNGFTIVELLIVIVVIAILAAITIVSYNGISQRAVASTIQSDLSSAAKKLEIAKTTSSTAEFPENFSATGLSTPSDAVRSYYRNGGSGFCVSLTQKNASYYIESNGSPKVGLCGDGSLGLGTQTIFVYDTTLTNCATTVQLPITAPTSAPGSVIDWGDGNIEALTASQQSHSYAVEGTYTVKYDGPITTVSSLSIPTANKGCLSRVNQWKDGLTVTRAGFPNAVNLSYVAEPPQTVTNVATMFYSTSATIFNQNISGWDVSKVTNMNQMFQGATSFNQDLSRWNVSSVTSKPPTDFSTGATSWTLPKPTW
jgi:prepilin-type N-terminal cleavage/methylation domain-containing protein